MSETQTTTMDRIFDLILSATQAWTQDEAAEQIAAEIDRLTAERDEAAQMHREREEFRLKQINDIRQERDEAREIAKKYEDRFFAAASQAAGALAEIDTLTADNAQAKQWLVNGVAKIVELERQRAEAIQIGLALTVERDALRAELESARPKAKAWDRMVKLHAEGWSVEYALVNARRLAEAEGTTL